MPYKRRTRVKMSRRKVNRRRSNKRTLRRKRRMRGGA